MQNTENQVVASGIPVRCAHLALADVATLVPNPRNPNRHPDKQVALLAKVIRHQGWRSPIVVSNRSGFVVKGHGRLEAAKLLQVEQVPIDRQDYATEADEWADLIADNRLAELSETDDAALKALLDEVEKGGVELELAGMDAEGLEDIGFGEPETDTDAEPQIDNAAELNKVWQVKPGDLWRVGEHRLLCGDSTKAEDVAKVLAGDVPLLMVTDTPYGVEYDAGWRNEAMPAKNDPTRWKDGQGRATGAVTNDDRADWSEAWRLFPGDAAYVWHAGNMAHIVAESLLSCDMKIRAQIVWAKNQLVIGRGDYHPQHEPCWYCVRDGKPGLRTDDRKQTTLWQIDKPQKSETGHSTQKPIECMARPIRNHHSEMVYDPFLGSGTTMVACENLSRKCRGIEISPDYCAVILQRMKDAFPELKIARL